MRFKNVMRWDSNLWKLRLCRFMWEKGRVGDGNGYSRKLTLALRPRLISWGSDDKHDWRVTLLGLEIHSQKNFGGIYA